MPKTILIFSHNYLVKDWRIIVDEQLMLLKRTGLYEKAEKIFLGVYSDSHENIIDFNERIVKFDISKKCQIFFQSENDCERQTLIKLQEICKYYDDANVLYYHTKGVTTDRFLNPEKYRLKTSWRNAMEYFTIERWSKCTELLEKYDCVGILYAEWKNPEWSLVFFSGNFWWSTSKHINKTPSMLERNNWMGCESLITSIPHNACNLYYPKELLGKHADNFYYDPEQYRKL